MVSLAHHLSQLTTKLLYDILEAQIVFDEVMPTEKKRIFFQLYFTGLPKVIQNSKRNDAYSLQWKRDNAK